LADAHKNFAYSTVATAPSPATSGTSLVVASGGGAAFPATPFNATIWPTATQPSSANAEIVRVTARATDTLTITRAQEGSTARSVVVGDQIAATITTKTLTDIETVIPMVWAASTAYTLGQLITHDPGTGPILYQATTAFTSPGTFNTTNLVQVAVAPGAVILTGSVPYSQPGSAVTGQSGVWTAPASGTVTTIRLSCVGAPVGSALTVNFLLGSGAPPTSTSYLTGTLSTSQLSIPAGATTVAPKTPAVAFSAGDQLAVNATSVGSTTAATGVVAQFDYTQVIA